MIQVDKFLQALASMQGDPVVLILALVIGLFGRNALHVAVAALLGGYVRYTFSAVTTDPGSQYYLWAVVVSIMFLSTLVLIGRQLLRRVLAQHRGDDVIR